MDWLFLKLADAIGLKIDQVRYVTLFFLSIPLAYVFRVVLHYKYTSCTTRHLFSMLFGILFCWLCFKWQTLILIGFILFGYCLLLMLPPSSVHMLVHNIIIIIIVIIMIVSYSLIYALTGVGMGHIYRMYIDYGGYSLDFTGYIHYQ
jgi:lysophospholipid acyltransferase 1/2